MGTIVPDVQCIRKHGVVERCSLIMHRRIGLSTLVLLRFQNVSCRSVSVGFAEKTLVFGLVFMINAL